MGAAEGAIAVGQGRLESGHSTLVVRAAAGHRDAIADLYLTLRDPVLALCQRLLPHGGQAEEAASDVLIRLEHLARSYNGDISFKGWVLRAASNHCIDLLRRRQVERRWVEPAGDDVESTASPGPSSLAMLLSREHDDQIEIRNPAVARPLSHRHYPALLEDLSYEEIAGRLQMPRLGRDQLVSRESPPATATGCRERDDPMTCLDELSCMRYGDGDLIGDELRAATMHVAGCDDCRRLVAALQAEDAGLRAVVTASPARRLDLRSFAGRVTASLAIVLIARWGMAGFADWSWVGTLVRAVAVLADVIRAVGYPTALLAMVVLLLMTIAALRRRAVVALAVVLVLAFQNQPGALTRRTEQRVALVAANEVIEDSVFAAGQIVRVEGIIKGDLYAMASRVEVSGSVTGRVIAFAESVSVSGRVGSLIAAGRHMLLSGEIDTWRVFAEETRTEQRATTSGDAVVMGQRVTLGGQVSGRVTVYGDTLAIGQTARLNDLRVRVNSSERLLVSPGAIVSGSRDLGPARVPG